MSYRTGSALPLKFESDQVSCPIWWALGNWPRAGKTRGQTDGVLGALPAATGDCAEDDEQEYGAHKGDHDLNEDVGDCDVGEARKPATDECAENADDDVPDEPHALAGQNLAGKKAGNRADDDPDDDASELHAYTSDVALRRWFERVSASGLLTSTSPLAASSSPMRRTRLARRFICAR